MKQKVKWSIMALTIVTASATAAFTAKPKCFQCQTLDQYYYNGTGYVAAGTLGVDYNCVYPGNVCTYTTIDMVHYTPCITTYIYTAIAAAPAKKAEPKKQEPAKQEPSTQQSTK